MPFTSDSELPKGVKGLPAAQQTKWRKVFNAAYEGTCKNRGDKRDECASKIAWSQIGDKYKGKALTEFSMTIKSATHNKEEGTLRWKAVASDTDEDFYKDNMSLELFNDFIHRIEIKELAPEEYRSSFWQGGMPYLSVSHYTDLEGKAVPGPVETVFVDGNQLRSYGQFSDNPIGWACYSAICKDLYNKKAQQTENPIRISIAFLDFGHIHKSNGYEFIRESLDDLCPECVKEFITGEKEGKIYKKGQLVHLALTRVPANERTSMEVEKSMTTRKEDAASIIGDELAEEIDKDAKLVGKSQALVIKSDDLDDTDKTDEAELEQDNVEELAEELVEEEELMTVEEKSKKAEEADTKCPDGMSEEDCKKHKQEMMKKTKKVEKFIGEPVPVVVVDEPSAYHPFGGATTMKDAQAYLEAQKEQYRISDLWWAFQSIMDNIQSDENLTDKPGAISKVAKELKDMIGDKSMKMYALLNQKSEVIPEHELDAVFSEFKTRFDEIKSLPTTPDDKLHQLQEHFNVVGQQVVEKMKSNVEQPEPENVASIDSDNLVQALSTAMISAMKPVSDKLDLLLTQQAQVVKSPVATPVRRSIAPTLSMQTEIHKNIQPAKQSTSPTPKLHEIIRRSVG